MKHKKLQHKINLDKLVQFSYLLWHLAWKQSGAISQRNRWRRHK